MGNERETQSNRDQESQGSNRESQSDTENTTGENALGSGSAATNNDDLEKLNDE